MSSFREVPDDDDGHRGSRGAKPAQRELERKALAPLPKTDLVTALRRLACMPTGEEVGEILEPRRPAVRGEKRLELRPGKLGPRKTKRSFGARVGEQDTIAAVDDQDGVRRRVERHKSPRVRIR